jgi:hypothetical protein
MRGGVRYSATHTRCNAIQHLSHHVRRRHPLKTTVHMIHDHNNHFCIPCYYISHSPIRLFALMVTAILEFRLNHPIDNDKAREYRSVNRVEDAGEVSGKSFGGKQPQGFAVAKGGVLAG